MANGYSTRLYIPEMPDGVPPELFAEFTRIYASLRALSVNLDQQTGIYQYDKTTYSEVGANNVKSANSNVAYLKCAAAIPSQRLVNIGSSGVILAASPFCVGISLDTGAVDDFIPVCLFGALLIPGVVQGTRYYCSGITPGKLTDLAGTQFVGYGLQANYLFLAPTLS